MPGHGLKSIDGYGALICDMDGTLYFQTPMRAVMLLELLVYHGLHPWRAGDLMILRHFRMLREGTELIMNKNFAADQYRLTANKYKTTPEHVRSVIELWMQKKPLKWIRFFRDKKLIARLNRLRKQGVKIIVFSDYPARDKAEKIGLCADGVFSASDQDIGELKPGARGLEVIARCMLLKKSEMLMIGDRYEKDGKCAENFSIDYMILRRGMIARAIQSAACFSRHRQRQRETQD
jgi:HAD superfamily hydrolase (TIGR01549 family)